jgi:hypothetical protein
MEGTMTAYAFSELKDTIRHWDGKSTLPLKQIYEADCNKPDFASILVALLSEQDFQRGASWLLKHHVDTGHDINPANARTCYHSLDQLTHWDAQLHVLQTMHAMPVGADQKHAVQDFLEQCVNSRRTLIRAWAYTGFVVLAGQFKEYCSETRALLLRAEAQETAGSIRVRIRRGLEELEN